MRSSLVTESNQHGPSWECLLESHRAQIVFITHYISSVISLFYLVERSRITTLILSCASRGIIVHYPTYAYLGHLLFSLVLCYSHE